MFIQKSRLASLPQVKGAWLLLALSALIFEIIALYFQYAMDLKPCIMCIYQRTAVLGIFFSGLLGYTTCHQWWGRASAAILWLVSAIWGLFIAIEHVEIQTATFFVMCEIVPNFPQWLPLHEWLPAFFAATGDCGKIEWQFIGMSMPQWMIVVFSIYSLTGIIPLIARLLFLRKL